MDTLSKTKKKKTLANISNVLIKSQELKRRGGIVFDAWMWDKT